MPLRVSLEWLRDYLELPETPEELAETLTGAGAEVDRIVRIGSGWEGVFVARVIEAGLIPGSDHLQVAQLDVGGRQVQVVSGAPNIKVGDLVPWAEPGTTLPGGVHISEREFMRTKSQGMMCSPVELGLSEEADGILILGSDGATGQPLSELMPEDRVLVLETATNRADLLCHVGIARELSALLRRPYREPKAAPAMSDAPSPVLVEIANQDLCARYQARYLEGLTIGPAPGWMQRRLRAVGQKPISNAVDAANYVMFELGQPLHVFDADQLEGGIVVRTAIAGEQLLCLDGKTRELGPRTLVIADQSRPAALAGLVGGADSAVSSATTRVVVESANFSGVSIRATSRHFGLRTEASTRFEKQLHPELVPPAAARLTGLLQEIAGAGPASAAEAYPAPYTTSEMRLPAAFVSQILGDEVSPADVEDGLRALHFNVQSGEGQLTVTAPPWRLDVTTPIDLVEEVGRLRGYNTLPSTLPGRRLPVARILPPPDPEWRARQIVMGAGYDEVINISFSAPDEPNMGAFPGRRLPIANPMVSDQASMRTSLLPGLVRTVARNVAWGNPGIHIFELGRVFWPQVDGDLPLEARVLGVATHISPAGRQPPPGRIRAALLEAKGAIQLLINEMSTLRPQETQAEVPGLHPGRALRLSLEGADIGCLGQLHADLAAAADIPGAVVLAEIDYDALVRSPAITTFVPPPRFPAVVRDLSLTVPESMPARDVIEAISSAGGAILRTVELFDEYRGSQVAPGRKGFAFRLVFQSEDRTLTGPEVAAVEEGILDEARSRLGAEPRAVS